MIMGEYNNPLSYWSLRTKNRYTYVRVEQNTVNKVDNEPNRILPVIVKEYSLFSSTYETFIIKHYVLPEDK